MTRIQRLLCVQPGTQARPGGWLASAAITIAVVTACSALALARPAEHGEPHHGHDADVTLHPHDVDVVGVLRELGSEDAAFFEVLRDAGLDNRMMMMILEKLGPNERVQKALEEASARSLHIELRLHKLNEQLEEKVAAGHISRDEARLHFEAMLQEVKQDLRPSVIDEARRHMATVKLRLEDQVAAGIITDAEAEVQLHEAHDALKARMMARGAGEWKARKEFEVQLHAIGAQLKADVAEGLITEAEAKQQYEAKKKVMAMLRQVDTGILPGAVERLHKLHESVRADLAAGRISERQAEERIHAAATEVRELMAKKKGRLRDEMPESMRARLKELHEEIRADYEAGLITGAEAEDLMRAAKLELHEELKAEMEQRHAKKRRHKD